MDQVALKTRRLLVRPATQKDLRFLLKLWNDPEIMRYAGFAKGWDFARIKEWYQKYQEGLEKFGATETQLIHKLKDGKSIGETRLGRLKSGWSCRGYRAPKNKLTLMTDVKLLKDFWNKGYGTEAMKAMVRFVFTRTKTDLLLVPPHKENTPAIRVYEKAGLRKTEGLWYGYHLIYEMSKKEFDLLKRK